MKKSVHGARGSWICSCTAWNMGCVFNMPVETGKRQSGDGFMDGTSDIQRCQSHTCQPHNRTRAFLLSSLSLSLSLSLFVAIWKSREVWVRGSLDQHKRFKFQNTNPIPLVFFIFGCFLSQVPLHTLHSMDGDEVLSNGPHFSHPKNHLKSYSQSTLFY